jgi:hypothetical protein
VESVSTGIAELRSSQEEADTRMLLHAVHCADSGYEAVVIASEDTDVFVLCIYHSPLLSCSLYVKNVTKTHSM